MHLILWVNHADSKSADDAADLVSFPELNTDTHCTNKLQVALGGDVEQSLRAVLGASRGIAKRPSLILMAANYLGYVHAKTWFPGELKAAIVGKRIKANLLAIHQFSDLVETDS